MGSRSLFPFLDLLLALDSLLTTDMLPELDVLLALDSLLTLGLCFTRTLGRPG
jgi:hypothetical protein